MSIPSLDKADNGFWYAFWSDGRRSKRKSMGTKDQAVAKARFAQWLLIDGQAGAADAEYSCGDVWAVYMARHGEKNVAGPETLKANWKALAPHFADMPVAAVTQDAVDAYVAKRTSGRLGRKVKPQTCRKELSALMAALNFCARKPVAMYDSTIVHKIVLPEAAEPRDRWLKLDEMQRLLNAAARLRRGSRLSRGERFLWIALETAARLQAVLDLTWDRVDFETGAIQFDVPGRKKTKKKRATVAISRALRPVLERAYAERVSDLVMDNKADVWSTVQLIAIEAGFGGTRPKVLRSEKPKATGISPHVLRHTAATHMARRGVPLFAIAKTLGNTVHMVERVYAKWCPDDPAGTVDMISGGVLEAAS